MPRPRFDKSRDFVAARGFTFLGKGYTAGDPFPKEVADPRRLAALYESRAVNMSDGTAAPDPVTVEQHHGGYYSISAPWLDEPVRVRGKAKADAAAKELRDAGEPETHHGVTLARGENGWWTITREGSDTELKLHGEADAREAAATLRRGEEIEGHPFVPAGQDDDQDEQEGDEAPDDRGVVVEAGAVTTEAEGRWVVSAPWVADDDREVFDTEELAAARADELREAGPPEGWQPEPEQGTDQPSE